MKPFLRSTFLFGVTALFASVSVIHADTDRLIDVQKGDLPVVISAPHGGTSAIPNGEERTEGVTVRDMNTDRLAKLLAERLAERLEGKPHYIIAEFSRRFVDANRGPGFNEDQAYAGPVAQKQYEAYHGAIREAVDEIREKFGTGLLIDLHGQSRLPDKVIRGTVNGLTVTAMLDSHGLEALIGPNSLFGKLEAQGLGVEPAVTDAPNSPKDEVHFIGGYIVRAYGSHNADGIDSIQVEVGRDYRAGNVLEKTAEQLAEAIAAYVEHYLVPEKTAAE